MNFISSSSRRSSSKKYKPFLLRFRLYVEPFIVASVCLRCSSRLVWQRGGRYDEQAHSQRRIIIYFICRFLLFLRFSLFRWSLNYWRILLLLFCLINNSHSTKTTSTSNITSQQHNKFVFFFFIDNIFIRRFYFFLFPFLFISFRFVAIVKLSSSKTKNYEKRWYNCLWIQTWEPVLLIASINKMKLTKICFNVFVPKLQPSESVESLANHFFSGSFFAVEWSLRVDFECIFPFFFFFSSIFIWVSWYRISCSTKKKIYYFFVSLSFSLPSFPSIFDSLRSHAFFQ